MCCCGLGWGLKFAKCERKDFWYDRHPRFTAAPSPPSKAYLIKGGERTRAPGCSQKRMRLGVPTHAFTAWSFL